MRGAAHTNTAEGYFALLKRGIIGTFHHVSAEHLHRYLGEFDQRFNTREIKDGERALSGSAGGGGKRLTYRSLIGR